MGRIDEPICTKLKKQFYTVLVVQDVFAYIQTERNGMKGIKLFILLELILMLGGETLCTAQKNLTKVVRDGISSRVVGSGSIGSQLNSTRVAINAMRSQGTVPRGIPLDPSALPLWQKISGSFEKIPESLLSPNSEEELYKLVLTRNATLGEQPIYPIWARTLHNISEPTFYSVSVFRVDDEIYGVVAAHVVTGAENNMDQLGRFFLVDFIDPNGQIQGVRGHTVLISLAFDLALVKFELPDATLLQPLALDTQPLQVGDEVVSVGIIQTKEQVELLRSVKEVSPFSVRTNMPLTGWDRPGLCGSPVTAFRMKNGQKERVMVGVHIGSKVKSGDTTKDIGYVAPAWQVKQMVDAYRNKGVAPFMVTVDGKELFEMQVNEYIFSVEFFDKDGNKVAGDILRSDRLPSQRFWRPWLQHPSIYQVQVWLGRMNIDPAGIDNNLMYRQVSFQVPGRSEVTK